MDVSLQLPREGRVHLCLNGGRGGGRGWASCIIKLEPLGILAAAAGCVRTVELGTTGGLMWTGHCPLAGGMLGAGLRDVPASSATNGHQ